MGTGVEALRQEYDDPFVRWQVDPAAVAAVHRHGGAVLVEHSHDRFGVPVTGPVLLGLGPAGDLGRLLADAEDRLDEAPLRLTIERHALDALPTRWAYDDGAKTWDWMWTTTRPVPQPGEDTVEALPDTAEINALLDLANPDTHGRPDDAGMVQWLGVRDRGGALLAAGGRVRLGTGYAHLRGITTVPAARGRGFGSAISARLTRAGLAAAGVCTLGVYSDNTGAIRMYRRLGYRRGHTFVSGPLVDTQVDPGGILAP